MKTMVAVIVAWAIIACSPQWPSAASRLKAAPTGCEPLHFDAISYFIAQAEQRHDNRK